MQIGRGISGRVTVSSRILLAGLQHLARRLGLISSLGIAPACDGKVKPIDCHTPNKCTGEAPDASSPSVKNCEMLLADPVCDHVHQQLLQCSIEHDTCSQSDASSHDNVRACAQFWDALKKCETMRFQ